MKNIDLIPSVLFVLTTEGGGGGSHSVLQETIGMCALGAKVRVAIPDTMYLNFLRNYPEIIGLPSFLSQFSDSLSLAKLMADVDIVSATTNKSVSLIAEALELCSADARPQPTYYVQDYEPFFYPPDSAQWFTAWQSYTAIDGMQAYAKTHWLTRVVGETHGIPVAKVKPSIDHRLFKADFSKRTDKLVITAMLRPRTIRRGPKRTIRILQKLLTDFSEAIECHIFGASDEELLDYHLPIDSAIINHGVLTRPMVADVLKMSDLFIDCSDYQAFGRTALEGMACGCVPIVPVLGGTDEFAKHGVNSFVVDTRLDNAILKAATLFIGLTPDKRQDMILSALETASSYSVRLTSLSMAKFFRQVLT